MRLVQDNSNKDYLEMQNAFEHWFQTPLGRTLLADQRNNISHAINGLFGYQQLEVLVSHRLPMGNGSSLGHQMMSIPQWQSDMPENTLVSLSHELGLRHDSIDLAILHHTLDYAARPLQALREASRVVRGGGHLLIIGFNPISLWGIKKLLLRRKIAPWNGRFISARRVEDWLSLLDFEFDEPNYHFYRPPMENHSLLERFSFLDNFSKLSIPLGGYYMLLAKKQVGCSIAQKPSWKKAQVIGFPLANRVKPD